LNKKLHQLKGYNARQLRTEFPDKGWTPSSTNRLLKNFRDTGTVDRRQCSSRPRSASTDKNIDQVNDMVLSQEDQPRTHSTVREISRKTGIPKSSVVRIIPKDLQLKCFKRRRRPMQELTKANCTAGKLLLKKFFQFVADLIFFKDKTCSLCGCSSERIVRISQEFTELKLITQNAF